MKPRAKFEVDLTYLVSKSTPNSTNELLAQQSQASFFASDLNQTALEYWTYRRDLSYFNRLVRRCSTLKCLNW